MTAHSLPRTEALRVSTLVCGVRQLTSHWLKRRRMYRLREIDDHVLNDIGFLREELDASLQQPLSIDPVWDLIRRARTRRSRGQRIS